MIYLEHCFIKPSFGIIKLLNKNLSSECLINLQKIVPGINDVASKYPEIAKEAYQRGLSSVMPGDHEKKKWICKMDHIWDASPNSRTNTSISRVGSGCPASSELGFEKNQPAWIYWMEREEEQQIGISNNV